MKMENPFRTIHYLLKKKQFQTNLTKQIKILLLGLNKEFKLKNIPILFLKVINDDMENCNKKSFL